MSQMVLNPTYVPVGAWGCCWAEVPVLCIFVYMTPPPLPAHRSHPR